MGIIFLFIYFFFMASSFTWFFGSKFLIFVFSLTLSQFHLQQEIPPYTSIPSNSLLSLLPSDLSISSFLLFIFHECLSHYFNSTVLSLPPCNTSYVYLHEIYYVLHLHSVSAPCHHCVHTRSICSLQTAAIQH